MICPLKIVVAALESVYTAKLCGIPESLLLKLTVTFAPAGTVIVFLSNARFCAARSIVIRCTVVEPGAVFVVMLEFDVVVEDACDDVQAARLTRTRTDMRISPNPNLFFKETPPNPRNIKA